MLVSLFKKFSPFFSSLFEVLTTLTCLHCQQESIDLICRSCFSRIPKIESNVKDVYCYGSYDGILKNLIHQFKFENKFSLSKLFASLLCQTTPKNFDCILPVPLYLKKLQQRKYNQSALIAIELSKLLHIPCYLDVIKKPFETPSQTELSKSKRKKNVKGAFTVSRIPKILNKNILLVDDVYTTGATVNECKKVLIRAGAANVIIATLAKSP